MNWRKKLNYNQRVMNIEHFICINASEGAKSSSTCRRQNSLKNGRPIRTCYHVDPRKVIISYIENMFNVQKKKL